jgi:hypothetical protein
VKAPGFHFNPSTCKVENLFQAFAFKWVNLYRYVTALERATSLAAFTSGDWGGALFTFNPPVDP